MSGVAAAIAKKDSGASLDLQAAGRLLGCRA